MVLTWEMKFLQWEKENLVVCTCLFVVLAAMTDSSFLGRVSSSLSDNSKTMTDSDSDGSNNTSELSVFDQTFSEWEFRWVWVFFVLISVDTCPETGFSLALDVQSLDLDCGAAIVSEVSQMLKGRNLHHVGFFGKKVWNSNFVMFEGRNGRQLRCWTRLQAMKHLSLCPRRVWHVYAVRRKVRRVEIRLGQLTWWISHQTPQTFCWWTMEAVQNLVMNKSPPQETLKLLCLTLEPISEVMMRRKTRRNPTRQKRWRRENFDLRSRLKKVHWKNCPEKHFQQTQTGKLTGRWVCSNLGDNTDCGLMWSKCFKLDGATLMWLIWMLNISISVCAVLWTRLDIKMAKNFRVSRCMSWSFSFSFIWNAKVFFGSWLMGLNSNESNLHWTIWWKREHPSLVLSDKGLRLFL